MSETEQAVAGRPRWILPTVVGVVALLLGVGAVAWATAGNPAPAAPSPAAAASSAPRTVFVSGVMRVPAGPNWKIDTDCSRGSQYDDIHLGAQVAISDAAGKVLAIAELGRGRVVDDADLPGMTTDCELPFSATVPLGVGPYGFEIGRHGIVRYNEADINHVELSLD